MKQRARDTPDDIKGKRTTVSFLKSILVPQRVQTRGLGKVGQSWDLPSWDLIVMLDVAATTTQPST
jgi:hypothetical protein